MLDELMERQVARWVGLAPEEPRLTEGLRTLPFRWGGMQLRSLAALGPVARLGSWATILEILPVVAPLLAGVVDSAADAVAEALCEPPPAWDRLLPNLRRRPPSPGRRGARHRP